MYHQHTSKVDFAFNNTYGLKAINESWYRYAMDEATKKGGVKDKVLECRRLARELDPEQTGTVDEVNRYCTWVSEFNMEFNEEPYEESRKYGRFDITVSIETPSCAPHSSVILSLTPFRP